MVDNFANVDEYIGSFPKDVQVILAKVRSTIHEAAPGAGEKISYQIPAVTLNGKNLVYFAGWRSHISLYPIPASDEALAAEMAPYVAGKGTLKFPLGQEVPYDLIKRVIAQLLVVA